MKIKKIAKDYSTPKLRKTERRRVVSSSGERTIGIIKWRGPEGTTEIIERREDDWNIESERGQFE